MYYKRQAEPVQMMSPRTSNHYKEDFELLDPAMNKTTKYIIYAVIVIVILLLIWLLWSRFSGGRSYDEGGGRGSASYFY